MIKLQNVKKNYGKTPVIENLNLEINDGEFLVVLGPSGCGKTTLLRMVAGLEEITEGSLYFDDVLVNDYAPKDRNISMVFQNYALFPNMNVYENIAFGLKVRKNKKDVIDNMVKEIAERLQIVNLLKRKPNELSGGEQQRVALARAMVKKPKIYLFDEPLSSLDVNLKEDLRTLIKEIHNETKATFIYVTHDQNEALALADRIVVMNKGQIIQIDNPVEIYSHPNCLFVAKFMGEPKVNELTFKDKIKCFIRPENIKIGKQNSNEDVLIYEGKILSTEFIGNGYVTNIEIGDDIIKVITVNRIEEDIVKINIRKDDLLFFDDNDKSITIDLSKINVRNNKLILEEEL